MIRKLTLTALGMLALAGCKQETIVAGEQPDPMATELAAFDRVKQDLSLQG
jgi:hypothetical protein